MLKNSFENIHLNKEICEFIGAFIGDGYIGNYGERKNQFLIGISGDQKLDEDYLKNYLRPLIMRNFPFTKPKLYYRNDENTLMLRIYCKKLYYLFLKYGFTQGRKSNSVKIPKQILKNNELMNATIRGIFDTDGCIFLDKRKVYSVAGGEMIISLENNIDKELIKKIAYKRPQKVVCLNSGFKTDADLTNAAQILKTKEIEFRTA